MEIAVIGGTGVYDPELLAEVREEVVVTPYGTATLAAGRYGGKEVAFLPRHGAGHTVPPHLINYRANLWALKMLGVRFVLATSAVGSLNPKMAPGELVALDQFLDFTKSRAQTFYEGGPAGVVHVDYTDPYCPELRESLLRAAEIEGLKLHRRGCYVCTEGPRYETPAEIRAFRTLGGDLVGMTSVPEVVLAREAEMCYAGVALVTNWAAGLTGSKLTHQEVVALMEANLNRLRRLLARAIDLIDEERVCACHTAVRGQAPLGPPGEEGKRES
ncbi:MAG: S-methyl-5'-thioadenosine phosphorylase [Bacillota bacterium]|nr:S-methyl-5'-thioadenosine phosphorylase [Bacillota bacterium]